MHVVALVSLGISIVAVLISAAGLVHTRQVERLAKEPRLTLIAEDVGDEDARQVFYRLRNDGPRDLDSVVVFRPRPSDGLTYAIAKVGGAWADDDVELGRLALTQEAHLTFACGSTRPWPDFRVIISGKAGRDSWRLVRSLEEPRWGPNVH